MSNVVLFYETNGEFDEEDVYDLIFFNDDDDIIEVLVRDAKNNHQYCYRLNTLGERLSVCNENIFDAYAQMVDIRYIGNVHDDTPDVKECEAFLGHEDFTDVVTVFFGDTVKKMPYNRSSEICIERPFVSPEEEKKWNEYCDRDELNMSIEAMCDVYQILYDTREKKIHIYLSERKDFRLMLTYEAGKLVSYEPVKQRDTEDICIFTDDPEFIDFDPICVYHYKIV